ncbi:hypothetical protein O4158_19710, partial [Gordonia amicalis]|uniref:hypothetical protein n=1 Tax=Gordonia amicalis TaxID=89053 RepID=UPI001EE63C06
CTSSEARVDGTTSEFEISIKTVTPPRCRCYECMFERTPEYQGVQRLSMEFVCKSSVGMH